MQAVVSIYSLEDQFVLWVLLLDDGLSATVSFNRQLRACLIMQSQLRVSLRESKHVGLYPYLAMLLIFIIWHALKPVFWLHNFWGGGSYTALGECSVGNSKLTHHYCACSSYPCGYPLEINMKI